MTMTKALTLTALILIGGMTASAQNADLKEAVLDSQKMTWSYGKKQLKLNKDGTFAVISNGRRLASAYFFIATPYRSWQTNQRGFKKNGEYKGKRIEVRDIKVENDKIIFSGLVPWQKQGEETIPGKWDLTVTSLGKGRFSFLYTYDIPEGQKRKDCGIFMNFANIRNVDTGDEGVWNPEEENKLHSFEQSVLKVNAKDPADNFQIECRSWTTQKKTMRFPVRFSAKSKEVPSFVIDFSKLEEK